MSLISFTPVTDGSTASASGVNTPLSTIYNDYNGGITDANISASAAIALSKLANFTISSYTNTGTAGGTVYYTNINGLKLAWGTTAAISNSGVGGITKTVDLTAVGFANARSAVMSWSATTDERNTASAFTLSATTLTVKVYNYSSSSGGVNPAHFLVIGS